jgi:hypothetical protein
LTRDFGKGGRVVRAAQLSSCRLVRELGRDGRLFRLRQPVILRLVRELGRAGRLDNPAQFSISSSLPEYSIRIGVNHS